MSTTPNNTMYHVMFAGGGRRFGGGQGGGFISGTVSAVDGTTVTIDNARTGESTVVDLSGAPTISKTVTGNTSDITTGETLVVTGTPSSGGTITATSIQVRPAGSGAPIGGPGTVQ